MTYGRKEELCPAPEPANALKNALTFYADEATYKRGTGHLPGRIPAPPEISMDNGKRARAALHTGSGQEEINQVLREKNKRFVAERDEAHEAVVWYSARLDQVNAIKVLLAKEVARLKDQLEAAEMEIAELHEALDAAEGY